MKPATQIAATGFSGGATTGHRHARAFSGGIPLTVEIQARVHVREGRERASFVCSGVPSARARQILTSVLALPQMEGVTPEMLRVDVHRADSGRYRHKYGLALAVAMLSSLARKTVPPECLFLGDLDLHGQVRDVPTKLVARLIDALDAFEVETPAAVVLSPDSATWVNAASTVRVIAARTLEDVIAAVWPGATLQPW